MDPGSYLKIFLGRWKIIVVAGLIGVLAGLVAMPAKSRPVARAAPAVHATHILIVDSAASGGTGAAAAKPPTAQTVQLTALMATAGEVPRRAAAALGIADPDALSAVVSASADPSVGTIKITAIDRDGKRAADVANTVASKLLEYLLEQNRARYTADLRDANAVVADLQRQLDAVQSSIARLPVGDSRNPTSDPVLVAQREAVTKRLQTAKDRVAAIEADGEPTAGFVTLQEARPVEGPPPAVTTAANAKKATPTTLARTNTSTAGAAGAVSSHAGPLAGWIRVPIAAAMGLLLGAGLALFRERLDARVRTVRAAERAFGLPVVAEIPLSTRRRRMPTAIAVDTEPLGLEAESYRLLRSRLLQADPADLWLADGAAALVGDLPAGAHQVAGDGGQGPAGSGAMEPPSRWGRAGANGARPVADDRGLRVVLVTSPAAGDGKTAVTVNLAAAVSEVGTTALVLDLDFRRSTMDRFFDGKPAVGLSDVVEQVGGIHLDDVVCSAVNRRLHVALSGRPLAHPSQVLVAERQVVTEARTRADVVLVDTPPVLAVSDTSELIPSSDAVLVVCRLNKTTIDDASRTSEALARLRAKVLGVVLVGTPPRTTARGGYLPPEEPGRRKPNRLPALAPVPRTNQPDPPVPPAANLGRVEEPVVAAETVEPPAPKRRRARSATATTSRRRSATPTTPAPEANGSHPAPVEPAAVLGDGADPGSNGSGHRQPVAPEVGRDDHGEGQA